MESGEMLLVWTMDNDPESSDEECLGYRMHRALRKNKKVLNHTKKRMP